MFKRHVAATVAAAGIALAPLPLAAESHSDPLGLAVLREPVDAPTAAPTEAEAATIAIMVGVLLVFGILAHDEG